MLYIPCLKGLCRLMSCLWTQRPVIAKSVFFACVWCCTCNAQAQPQDAASKIDALLNAAQSNQNEHSQETHRAFSAPNESTPHDDEISNAAFSAMTKNLLPLSTDQIKTLHYLFDQSQKAVAQAADIPPKPTSSSLNVDLAPGATPPLIRLQQGYVSSLVFIDATGGTWPIDNYDVGDPKNFNIQWDAKNSPNILMLQSMGTYQQGNLAVKLHGLDTPVMITLITGQHAVDYRIDFRIPKIGPNPNSILGELPRSENPELLNILDGIPPTDAQTLAAHGRGEACQVWLLHGRLYVRTRMTLLSPAFVSTMRSADGMNAYEVPIVPVLLAMSHGELVRLSITGL